MNYPPGTDTLPEAPWNEVEQEEVHECIYCPSRVNEKGEACGPCQLDELMYAPEL